MARNANRLMKTLGLIAATGIGVGLILFGVENIRGRADWENFKKEWEAKGEVFDYKQIVPKPIPSEKNFAHIPLLKPLYEFKWNEDQAKIIWLDQKKFDQTQSLLRIEGDSIIPKLSVWLKSQPIDLEAWQTFFRAEKGWPHPEKAGKPSVDVLQALGKFEATMAKLTQAAKERPLCLYDVNYERHYSALLPHLAIYKNIVRSF